MTMKLYLCGELSFFEMYQGSAEFFANCSECKKFKMEDLCLKMHKDAIYSQIWLTWIH